MAEALCKFGSGDGGSRGKKNTTRRSILDALEESRSLAAEETTGYGREERIEECMQRFLDDFHGDVLEEILLLMRCQGDKVELSSEDEVHAIAVEKVLQAESLRGKKLLTLEEKTSYFETFLVGRCGEVVPLICRVYQLQDSSLSDMYSRRIAELLPERGAKELSKWIIPLEIGDRFFPPFLVRHCIAANAWTVLDQLVAKYAHVGLVAVNLYDQFLGMSKCERIAAYTGIQPTPWDPVGFNPRVSDDRLIGWCRVLGIDFLKHCPGLRKQRALRVFRFFVDATFFNRTMSYDAFSEMSEALTKRVPHVLPGFPDYLDWRELHHEAAKWAKKYDLGHTLLTDIARTAMRELSEAELTAESQATIGEVDGPFYELRIPFSSVHWIDAEDAFCHFMRPLLETVDVVGIDGEWVVPEFGPAQSMAVMQIATREDVYLIDMVALRESLAGEAGRLLKTMFTSTKVKKLGFDLKQDFRILSNIDDNLADLRKTSKCVFDMFSLLSHRKRFEKPVYGGQARISQGITFTGVLFPKKEGKMTPSKVIPHILGKPLDEREQESNWERRPLRRAQLEYAALDAYYLLDIFDTLQTRVESSGCPVQAFWDDVMMELEKIRLELLELEHHSKNIVSTED